MLFGHFNNCMTSLCLVGELDFPLLAGCSVAMRACTLGGHRQAREEESTMRFVYFGYFKALDPSFILSCHSREFKPLVETGRGGCRKQLENPAFRFSFCYQEKTANRRGRYTSHKIILL